MGLASGREGGEKEVARVRDAARAVHNDTTCGDSLYMEPFTGDW